MSVAATKRAGKNELAGGQTRLCAVLRQELAPDDLIRFVPSPDGIIVPDLARRLPGRGVWLSCSREIVAKAVNTKAFQRSLKQAIKIPDDLPDLIERLLFKRVMESLALTNKAGLVCSGYAKVDAAIIGQDIIALLEARNGSVDGRSKLSRKYQAIEAERGRSAEIISCLAIEDLSLALGRSNVVHAALSKGALTEKFIREAKRLERYRRSAPGDKTTATAPQAAKVKHG